jgi:hypothetical protein
MTQEKTVMTDIERSRLDWLAEHQRTYPPSAAAAFDFDSVGVRTVT